MPSMIRALLAAAAALSLASAPAAAAYPDHPITLINPYAAVRSVNDDPDYRRIMQDQAIELMALSPQDAGAYVRKDRADMQRLLGTLGLLAK